MARTVRSLVLSLAALGLGAVPACGSDFAPASEIASLRVLAVQKSAPYAKPGTKVRLSMLVADGSAARTRPVGGINRRGIFTGHWDGGDVVRQFRGDNGSWIGLAAYKAKEEPEPQP